MRFVFLLLFSFGFLLQDAALAQAPQVRVKRTYYDYGGQHLHEEYQFISTANQLVMKHGYYKEYDENGVIQKKYFFVKGTENGVCTDYGDFDDGKGPQPFIVTTYKMGVRHGYTAQWRSDDNNPRHFKSHEGYYYNDRRDGRNIDYELDGTKIIENWYRGVRQGETVAYGASGNRTQEEYYDKNGGLFSGTLEEKFANGQISKTAGYYNGQRNGPLQTFYPNGQLKTRSNYTAGRQVGATIGYSENGEPDAAFKVLLAEAAAARKQAHADSIQQVQKDIQKALRYAATRRQQDSIWWVNHNAVEANEAAQALTELAEQLFGKARDKQRALASSGKPQSKLYVDLYAQLLTEYQAATNGAERLAKAQRLLALMNLTEALHRGEQADLNKAIRKEDDLDKVLALTGI